MRSESINIYSFDELSKEAQEKAIGRYLENFYFFDEFIIEDWKERLMMLGFRNVRIMYTLNYSQGDGACFTGQIGLLSFLNNNKNDNDSLKLREFLEQEGDLVLEVSHAGQYCNENSIRFDRDEWEHPDDLSEALEELMGRVEIYVKNLCREIYEGISKEYWYQTSDEGIRDYFVSNDIEFLFDGRVYYK